MADDINAGRRTELLAQKAALEPVIRDLHNRSIATVSAELKEVIDHQIGVKERRVRLIDAELAAMDATNATHDELLADGYPDLPSAFLEPRLWEELQRENADQAAGAAIFKPDQATAMSVTLGAAESRTKA